MDNDIRVPTMGESITDATVGQILVPTGQQVEADVELIELETDKVNQVLYAPSRGQIEWLVKTGDKVKIGQKIGVLRGGDASVAKQMSEPQNRVKESSSKEKSEPLSPISTPLNKEEGPRLRVDQEAFISSLRTSPQEERKETRRPLSQIRKVIGERLLEAKNKTAMLTTFNEVDLSQVIAMRTEHQELFTKKHGTRLGFMSFFIKAVVSALEAFPDVNSYLDGQDIVQRQYYDIGVAVGTERGTFVPVIRQCNQLSFAGIEQAIDQYAKKAREGTIALSDLQGGGFTITNGGVYGSLLSTPLLNPPQCAILGMHKIEKRPIVLDDQIVIRPMMYLALSYDHRLIDGKESVSFLVHIKNQLEDPSRFLLHI